MPVTRLSRILLGLLLAVGLSACSSGGSKSARLNTPLQTVQQIDLSRMMGDWYVIATVPTAEEKGAMNAYESFRRRPDGSIDITLSHRKGEKNGPEVVRNAHARFVAAAAPNHSVWQLEPAIEGHKDYRIIFLSTDYDQAVVGQHDRQFVRVLSRNPYLLEEDYNAITSLLASKGFDLNRLKRVSQSW